MKRKSPAYSHYPKDFLADTQLLTTEQVGAYQLLLDSAWIGLPGCEQGFLPDDDDVLARLARVKLSKWRRIGAPIRALFKSNRAGFLFHKRLLEELGRQQTRSEKAADSARRRWDSGPRGEPSEGKNQDAFAVRRQSEGNAAEAAAAAAEAADEVATGLERGFGGEVSERARDLAPYLRAVAALYPPARLPQRSDVAGRVAWRDETLAALDEVYLELPDPLDFACRLVVWAWSDDWQERGGRFVPPAERWVRRGDWRRDPRRPRDPDSPGYGDELAAAIDALDLGAVDAPARGAA